MRPWRLGLFLAIVLFLPNMQVVTPQRDINAEESVAINFQRLRHDAGLPPLKRIQGSTFAEAACRAAERGNAEKVWVENANYAAMIYSTAKPEDAEPVAQLATRAWKSDQKLIVGACGAATPEFSGGRDWIAVGVLGGVQERSVAELLSGGSATAKQVRLGE